jgi:adenylylsulfate kinase-like enzyme
VDRSGAAGVLITGVYGSGKSSVGAELAYLLRRRQEPYALLDLDYLGWADAGDDDPSAEERMRLRNLASVASNYLDAGIARYVLAGFIRDRASLERVRDELPIPLKVVRLVVPLEEIERRLAADVTTERREDLREAAAAIAASEGVGVEDLVVANDRPVASVATGILQWLGWR